MKLPNGDRAMVDPGKIGDYCLNPAHPEGRHKARVFAETVGLVREDSPILIGALRLAARHEDVEEGVVDHYGHRYTLDFDFDGPTGSRTIRSVWIVRAGEDAPRLVTCYVP